MHAHPSPTLWLERDVPLADIVGGRARSGTGVRRELSVYVGTPYCLPTTPERCGFCLFPSEVYRSPDQLVTYLRYLAIEGELYRPWLENAEAAAIYFGGGTTNLYSPRQYGELMAIVRRALPRTAPDLEVTIEGVAQLDRPPRPLPSLRNSTRSSGCRSDPNASSYCRRTRWPAWPAAQGAPGRRSTVS